MRLGKAQRAGNSLLSIAKRCNARLGAFGGLPSGEARSGQLHCCVSLKEDSLFLRARASHLVASRLADSEK